MKENMDKRGEIERPRTLPNLFWPSFEDHYRTSTVGRVLERRSDWPADAARYTKRVRVRYWSGSRVSSLFIFSFLSLSLAFFSSGRMDTRRSVSVLYRYSIFKSLVSTLTLGPPLTVSHLLQRGSVLAFKHSSAAAEAFGTWSPRHMTRMPTSSRRNSGRFRWRPINTSSPFILFI